MVNELFADSDSEDNFSDIDLDEVLDELSDDDFVSDEHDNRPSARNPVDWYEHPWLMEFDRSNVGPQHVDEDLTEIELFSLFFSDDLYEHFVNETNRYANNYLQNHPNLPQFSRMRKWTDTSVAEMKAFIGILMLSGVCKRSSYELYWSTDPLIEIKVFRDIMPRDRFLVLLSFFHVSNNENAVPRDHPDHDKAFKIREVIDFLVPKWQHYFNPGKEIAVDESMIPYKGRTSLMQYMPAKPTKWGLKAWGLADSKTGYMYNWQLYLGKETVQRHLPVAHTVVKDLCTPLFDKGHVVYMDNFFSSPALFADLATHQTGACGTLRTNRQGVPEEIKTARPRAGQPPIVERDNEILYISWCDKRVVNVVTSVHSGETFEKEVKSKRHNNNVRIVQKPVAMQAYTQHMGGIDRADKAMTFYMVLHRCVKWWKKVFFYIWKFHSATRL